jgi:hypothetical protein
MNGGYRADSGLLEATVGRALSAEAVLAVE